jgi:hypothetical protein
MASVLRRLPSAPQIQVVGAPSTHQGREKTGLSDSNSTSLLAELLQNSASHAECSMETEEIFYTDGQDIVVTLSTLQVRDRFYSLKNIKKHSMAILQPARLPGIILFITGVAVALCGMANAFPADLVDRTGLFAPGTDTNAVAQWTGTALTVIGLLITVMLRERYAIRIATAEGEQDAVVSTRREYIREILDALNRAYMIIEMNTQPRLRRI